MITGYNTDVEHDGVVYHVQTEDKGLDTPLILSLVYVGGAILASKRSLYHDLIAAGFDEGALADRLQRQHKLICAAIHAGRIEDLKRMSQPRDGADARPTEPPPAPMVEQTPTVEPSDELPVPVVVLPEEPAVHAEPLAPVAPVAPAIPVTQPPDNQNLYLDLLEERDLRAGDFITFRIRVSRGTAENRYGVPDAHVTLKVLGTAFKPLICSARTDQDGVAILFAGLPRFTSGRAAILVRADAQGREAELRRIIQPA